MTRAKEQADGRFGLCPHCHNHDGYINIGSSHWFICDEHKVMWCIGSNLFSSWREETEDEQRAIYDKHGIDGYAVQDNLPPEDRVIAHVGHTDPSDSQSPYREGWPLQFKTADGWEPF
jgi:hypothetical protein